LLDGTPERVVEGSWQPIRAISGSSPRSSPGSPWLGLRARASASPNGSAGSLRSVEGRPRGCSKARRPPHMGWRGRRRPRGGCGGTARETPHRPWAARRTR